jgi:hypothetical protein
MKSVQETISELSNRSMAIANLYHQQSLELINLALTHNKSAIEASHHRATALLELKDTNQVHEMVSQHMLEQVNDYLKFAVSAYCLGFDAHIQATRLLQKQIEDGYHVANESFNMNSQGANPIATLALSMVKNGLDASHEVMNGVKAASPKGTESPKRARA